MGRYDNIVFSQESFLSETNTDILAENSIMDKQVFNPDKLIDDASAIRDKIDSNNIGIFKSSTKDFTDSVQKVKLCEGRPIVVVGEFRRSYSRSTDQIRPIYLFMVDLLRDLELSNLYSVMVDKYKCKVMITQKYGMVVESTTVSDKEERVKFLAKVRDIIQGSKQFKELVENDNINLLYQIYDKDLQYDANKNEVRAMVLCTYKNLDMSRSQFNDAIDKLSKEVEKETGTATKLFKYGESLVLSVPKSVALGESFDESNQLYNFDRMILSVQGLYDGDTSELINIKSELNKFFSDKKCKDVIFTHNVDGIFFGIMVNPVIPEETVRSIINFADEEDIEPINEYYVEFDSKLLDPLSKLTSDEITALLIHEVNQYIGSSNPLQDISTAYHMYVANNNEDIRSSQKKQEAIHVFAINNTMRKMRSIFEKLTGEYIANDFAVQYGFNASIESAHSKLGSFNILCDNSSEDPFTFMRWALRVSREISRERGIKNMIQDAVPYVGSTYQKIWYNNVYKVLANLNVSVTQDRIVYKSVEFLMEGSLFKRVKLSGLRNLENDLYEYNIRICNVESESEALATLRGLNNRISTLNDYIDYQKLTSSERTRCEDLIRKFVEIRTKLTEQPTYRNKYLGLFTYQSVKNGQLQSDL